VELIASGGTARALQEAGLPVTAASDLTQSPEILGGRVKTLHPAIHGGILSRRTAQDQQELQHLGWAEIDLVVVNLYPFQATAADPNASEDDVIEQIDIGGVALLRAAAKNWAHVAVLCDPQDYASVMAELRNGQALSDDMRRRLAAKVFAHTASYDTAITRYFGRDEDELPQQLLQSWTKLSDLRYGENPHQKAAYYQAPGTMGPMGGNLLQGKALSYNNILDIDAAWRAVEAFDRPSVVIVKHLSPCGIASADSLAEALPPALAGDPVSAFGSVVAANRTFDADTARAIGKLFVEAIVAPSYTDEALQVLAERKNCRLLEISQPSADRMEYRGVRSGLLVQEQDRGDDATWKVVTERAPSKDEMDALRFAWQAVAHVKSNAILLARGEAAVGIGGGMPSRVDAVHMAATKAGPRAQGSVMASDAFFPFPDGIEEAAKVGVSAIVQPGGAMRDEKVIAAANELGIAMCFTGVRHFRH
jgi:phosphoribosylaminoimidazolecarboxamide formyltransferase/IMP cyclohydrolase